MAKLDDGDKAALEIIRELYYERNQLSRQVELEAKKIEERIFGEWDRKMTQAVTYAKNRGIANRQIGMAFKTTNNKTSREIVDKYWSGTTTPTTPGAAPDTADPTVAITGSREAPLLTLTNWRAHATTQTKCMDGTNTPVLNLTEEPLRLSQSGRWYMIDKRDGVHMVTQRELANPRSELQQTVTEAVNALG